jgi:hypothetical protein
MIEEMETFVFTLGLTEAWANARQQVVYGSHPAVVHESFQMDGIAAVNFDYEEVVADLEQVLALIAGHSRKGGARLILTVSPVALAATHQDSHVVAATAYSKSVLRAAAGKLAGAHANVDYFPAYEIFALSPSFGQFLAEDLRDVNRRGVEVAMRVFGDMFLDEPGAAQRTAVTAAPPPAAAAVPEPDAAQAECDEIANAFFGGR